MSLDWPATGAALWSIYDQTGIRPEWVLPVVHLESGFDPSVVNPGGCVGLFQLCPGTYGNYVSVPVSEYRTWSASQQLAGPALAYWRNALGYGPIRSATRLMQAQLAPGELSSAPSLDSVVYRAPSSGYEGNRGVFDPSGKGYFTVQDLANAMASHASDPAVRDAIARTYALRPGEQPHDPVYGDDFGFFHGLVVPPRRAAAYGVVFTLSALSIAAAAAYAAGWELKRERR